MSTLGLGIERLAEDVMLLISAINNVHFFILSNIEEKYVIHFLYLVA